MNLSDATNLISCLYIARERLSKAADQFYFNPLLDPLTNTQIERMTDMLDDLHVDTLKAYTAILDARTNDLTPVNALLHTVVLLWDYEGDGLHNE